MTYTGKWRSIRKRRNSNWRPNIIKMPSCIGWLFDISIEHGQAVLWVKTIDRKILKLIDSYQPSFYILPRNESDGLHLFQVLSQQTIVDKVRWEEDKLTNLFDRDCTTAKKKLICVYPQFIQYYAPILKILEKDQRVKQLFNTDLSHIQQYLFTKLRIEPTSKVEVKYEGIKLLRIIKVKDDEQEVSPPPFSLLYFDIQTSSGKFTSEDPIRMISVRYEDNGDSKEKEEHVSFQSDEENTILQDFSNYLLDKDPDIVVCTGESGSKLFHYLFVRITKLGLDLQLGREALADEDLMNLKHPIPYWIRGRICLENSAGSIGGINRQQQHSVFDGFAFAGLIERSRFGFLPLGMASRYGINRLIDSRNCYELIQRGFVISKNNHSSGNSENNNNNHERIRTLEELVSRDKGGMIISPQVGLHENVVSLDYDSEYANLIVNHNLSYETVTLQQQEKGAGIVVTQQSNDNKKGLLPTVVEKFLKRRLYFKKLLKELPKESTESFWCEQRVNSLKNILVCLYGTTGSLWNRYGNVLAFEEINKISREILIKTKDIVQQLGYELVYADTDSVFIKSKDFATAADVTTKTTSDYEQIVDVLSKETGLSISIDYNYKFLVLLPIEADENIEALKHYYGITQQGELVVRGIEIRRHDIPNFIKQFQTELLYTLFNCKDSAEVVSKGYENCLLLVTKAIDKIMIGSEDLKQEDLVISKLLRQNIEKYKSLFPHVSAAIQLLSNTEGEGKHPTKGDTIQYIYTNSKHKNPLCRVVPLEILQKEGEGKKREGKEKSRTLNYDREKYREMILDAAETVLGFFGFDRMVYGQNPRKDRSKKKKWYEELYEERTKDIQAEFMMEKQ
jgi:DNA polymerase elongation subunit (family B)